MTAFARFLGEKAERYIEFSYTHERAGIRTKGRATDLSSGT
ncbi:hypothetical protein [Mesorhizobium sp. M4A.F.Ca.ET.020.02.1.1]|nr:hypothetical protein [Mesorhizobium sp. M4A.F.Ca.ET.020.02.1.1]